MTAPSRPPTLSRPPTGKPNGSAAEPTVPKAINTAFQKPGSESRGLALLLNAVPGWGKTSLGAFAPNSAFILAPLEGGYLTLFKQGLAPERPYAFANDWEELLGRVHSVESEPEIRTLVLDSYGGFEEQCMAHVCRRDFDGDWGEKGFAAYQKGVDATAREWRLLVQRLEAVTNRGINVLFLAHTRIESVKNPIGPDYDHYTVACEKKTRESVNRWTDATLFGDFDQLIIEKSSKARPKAGTVETDRILRCEYRTAWDAKNRLGLPDTIVMPNDPSQMWPTLMNAIEQGRKANANV